MQLAQESTLKLHQYETQIQVGGGGLRVFMPAVRVHTHTQECNADHMALVDIALGGSAENAVARA